MQEALADVSPQLVQELLLRVQKLEEKSKKSPDPDRLSLVVFSGDLDRLLAAFVIATGAAACGLRVSMFFTFWGTAALKKSGSQQGGKGFVERMFGWMLPGGFHRQRLSKMDMCGLGRRMMMREMAKKRVPSLPDLVNTAEELEVEISICEMSMSLMGIRSQELLDYPNLKYCGVARFVEEASLSGTTLFI